MTRIKYYFRRLITLDIKNMWRIAGIIAKEIHKPRIFILSDMVWCSFKYQAGYNDYYEYQFYLLNAEERKTFITVGIANSIILKSNKREDWSKFSDKSQFNEVFKDFVGRDSVDIRTHNNQEIKDFLKSHPVIVAKITDSLMGNGIEKFEINETTDIDQFIEERKSHHQYLLEAYFIQHPELARLHPNSVNTIRVITYFDGETVHIMQSVLKIGNHGSHLDNFGAGGMYTVLSDDGVVIYPAFDKDAVTYDIHPYTHEEIVGFKIPLYDNIVQMLDKAARVVPTVKYVGWDVAVGPDKPAIIEGNYNTGVFQMKPSITGNKTGLLPKYKSIIKF